MKKILMTLVLLVGIVAGLFAQKLTYQAVIRDNNQQLVVNTAVKATVTIDFAGDQADYTTTITDVSTNLHGLLTIEFGDGSLVGRDWTNATIAVKVVNAATPSIVYVNDEPRPVSAVPYALSVDGMAIQQYLTEHKYVTEMQVGNQIHDSISNVAGKLHTHDNMAILNATEATYTKADSLKLKGIADSAEVNVQSDWKQTNGSKDDYIKNKPSITDTVNNILTTGKYVTETTLDGRHYLTSDSAVIIAMQGNIATNKADITTNTADIAALAGRMNTFNTNVCDSVKNCDFSGNTSIQNMLQQLEDRIAALSHKVDSLAALIPGGDTTEVPDGQPCPGAPTVSDGTNTYNTVKIGNQCWMKENLRTNVGDGVYPKKNDGQDDLTPEEQVIYGRLYSWTAMMNGKASSDSVPSGVQGICPTGWHVPSDAEWTQLTDYVKSKAEYKCGGGDNNIANALSAATGWQSPSECGAGYSSTTLNKTGFSAVPAGDCFFGGFRGFGDRAYFWSATLYVDDNACSRYLSSYFSRVAGSATSLDNGISVRCLRDAGTGGGGTTPVPVEVSCEQVMECMGDTLGKLNKKIENLKNTVDSLAKLVHGGDTVKFTCGTSKVKDVDGNEYSTVIIGKQCWMKENLKTTKNPNGDAIEEGVYVPNGDSSEVETYGRLYTWSVVMNGAGSTNYPDEGEKVQGICPEGWHVPSDAEWTRLTDYVNSEAEYRCGETDKAIANALSSSTGWNGPSGCNPGSDKPTRNLTGFSAVPAGRFYNKPHIFGNAAHFWSATQYGDNIAWDRFLFISNPLVIRNYESKDNGSSVRCLRDAEVLAAMSVTTDSANIDTNNSATLHGNVTNMGEYSEVYAGFKYGTSVSTLTSIASGGSAMLGAGRFSYTVTGLTDGTQYYFKAFAANGADTVYGEVKNFTMGVIYDGQPCPGAEKVKDVDGNEYNTVKIGNQCWMKENLRTTKYADGTAIAKGTSASTTKAYRYYPNNDSSKVSTYGYLYNWKAVMDTSSSSEADPSDVQGICPTGWHVPSVAEFGMLAYYVNGKTEYRCDGRDKAIANALSASTGWNGPHDCTPGSDKPTRNLTGFSAVPAGRYFDGDLGGLGTNAYFWSATQCYGDDAWYPNLDSHVPGVFWFHGSKSYGLSVRCLKD